MRQLNRFLLASVMAAAAAATNVAFADEEFVSTMSREEVLAELQAFRASGVNPWSGAYNPLAGFKSTRTRDEVQAEYLATRKEVAAFTGEDSGSAYLAADTPIRAPIQLANQLAATQ